MHNINQNNGKASIVWTGDTPWHRLGTRLDNVFDAETALREGGLGFTVATRKIGLVPSDGVWADSLIIPDRRAIVRTDTQDVLGVVSSDYRPLQNVEAFSFFDGLFGADKARYEVAGVIGRGEQIWLLAKLPGEFLVGRDDVVGKWLLLMNSHDGGGAIRAKFTPTRVVCANTLAVALGQNSNEVRVQHTGNVPAKLELAGKLLAKAGLYFDEVQQVFQRFQLTRVTDDFVKQYATRVLATTELIKPFDELHSVTQNRINRIAELSVTGHGMELPGVRGSLWAAYNAVTEFIDHEKTTRLSYLDTGRGAEIKQRAFDLASEHLNQLN